MSYTEAVTLCIDPGSAGDGSACALGDQHNRLVHVAFAKLGTTGIVTVGHWEECDFDRVIVERPEVQGDRTRRANPAHLMGIAWDGSGLARYMQGLHMCTVAEWTPSEWKGSESKPIHHKRLWKVLDASERLVLGGSATERAIMAACEKGALCRWSKPGADLYPKKFTTHNLLDAAAMLAVFAGRLKKVG